MNNLLPQINNLDVCDCYGPCSHSHRLVMESQLAPVLITMYDELLSLRKQVAELQNPPVPTKEELERAEKERRRNIINAGIKVVAEEEQIDAKTPDRLISQIAERIQSVDGRHRFINVSTGRTIQRTEKNEAKFIFDTLFRIAAPKENEEQLREVICGIAQYRAQTKKY